MISNIGPHVQTWTDATVVWCERAHPCSIKVVATQDKIPTLARWYQEGWLKSLVLRSDPEDYLLDWDRDIQTQAQEEIDRNLEFAQPFVAAGLGDILWLEGRNEQPVWNEYQMVMYAVHEAIRANLIAKHNLKALTFQFPVGHPDLALWPFIADQLRIIQDWGGGLALHQYSQPRLDSAGEWTTWRHLKVYDLLPLDLQRLPLFITEASIDGGASYDGAPVPRPRQGWHAYCIDEQDYVAQIKTVVPMWGQAKGVHLFTFGNPDIWSSFETDTTTALAEWLGDNNGTQTGTVQNGGGSMTNEELWNKLTAPYDTYPALVKAIVGKGGVPIGVEDTEGGYTFQLGLIPSAGQPSKVVAYAKTGDWGNVIVANKAEALPFG